MPNLMATLIASVASWLVQDALPKAGGKALPAMISFCVFIVIFPIAKRYLTDIRPGS